MAPARRRRSTRSPAPAAGAARARDLPVQHANDLLPSFKGRLHTVKTQQLNLEDGSSILIARVKVPTPKGVSGHLIRRFDTDAISATSLFKVAFPHADDEAEKAEMAYLVERYNTRIAGDEDETGSGKLTGTWVPTEDATALAKEYGVLKFATELINFEPAVGDEGKNGALTSPPAPTPSRRKSKSPAPPSATRSSKRQRVTSPPASRSGSMQSLAPPTTTPSKIRSTRASKSVAQEVDELQEEAAEATGGIQVTQEIITDEATGKTVEETKVTFTGSEGQALVGGTEQGIIGTDEQAQQAVEQAKALVESLKEQGMLAGGKSKRERDEGVLPEDDDDEDIEQKPGFFGRMFGKRPKTIRQLRPERRLQVLNSPDGAHILAETGIEAPNRRRFIAVTAMAVAGAAAAAVPYFF